MARYQGVVKWFNDAQDFGFIGCDDGEAEVFADFSWISNDGHASLEGGEVVDFDSSQEEQGLQAEEIMPVADAKLEAADARPRAVDMKKDKPSR